MVAHVSTPLPAQGDSANSPTPPGAAAPAAADTALSALLADLDGAQRRAVTHGEGALLIVAGAGTGKTRVITRRIAWLIATRRARPSEILALTFTDRAADEMQARVDELVPYGYADTAIHTFHAFGDRLVREFAFQLGLPSDPRVLSRAETVVFLREHLFELGLDRYRPLGDPTRFLGALAGLISRAKDEDVDAAAYLAHARELVESARSALDAGNARPGEQDGQRAATALRASLEEAESQLELAGAYARYQELLSAAGYLDFGDQVHLALRLLREHAVALQALRRRFRYILVDEFQDTNRTQLELLALLAGPGGNLTVVGDDDQAIYAFRGAAIRNILEFRERFSARVIVLRRNHRSRAPILEAARRLIRHNDPDRLEVREGLDKRLVAVRRARRPAPVRHHAFATSDAEADFIGDQIAQRLQRGIAPREIAVLVRTNAIADPLLRSLNMRGIPWRFSGSSGLYAQPQVRRLLAFLRAVANPDSTVDLYALAAEAPYRLGGTELARLVQTARRTNRSLWSVLREQAADGDPALGTESREALRRLVGDLEAEIELAQQRPAGEVLYDYLRRCGTLAELAAAGPGAEARLRETARFFDVVRRQSELLRDPRIAFLAPYLGVLVEAGDEPSAEEEEVDAVSVLTVHRAKGLEFRIVFVAGLADGRFPMRARRATLDLPRRLDASAGAEGADNLAEERRLCYVAMTRARDELVLTSAADTGGRRLRQLSPFVLEALDSPAAPVAPVGAASAIERNRPAEALSASQGAGLPSAGRLSFTQLEDYLSCPARFRYRHVLRLPSPPHHAITYGIAVHEAVAAFGRSQLQGRPLGAEGLLEVFARAWSGEGFLSREHEEARLRVGRAALLRFREEALVSAYHPIAIEEPFTVPLGGIRLQGRFDRVDEGPEGVVVTDFKSSDVRDPARARQRARESLQLALYALAWQAREGALPAATQLVFLDSGVIGRVAPDAARLARAATKAGEAADGIAAGAFGAQPDPVTCRFCPFHEICPDSAA
ncbi:MAG: ATP-dependent helicase [Candidatus Limnocylindrales bacterium]